MPQRTSFASLSRLYPPSRKAMKTLPTVLVARSGGAAIEVTEFENAYPVAGRDAIGYYFSILLEPQGDRSRVAVLFSGLSHETRPDQLGIPDSGDKTQNLVGLALAALGDYLDENGLPPFTPSGVNAAEVECFSYQVESWLDRAPATDDEIELYVQNHAYSAWKFAHNGWELGPPDQLRLAQPLRQIDRILRLGDGSEWSVEELNEHSRLITPTQGFLRQRRALEKKELALSAVYSPPASSADPAPADRDTRKASPRHDVFICHASEDKDDVARPLAEALRDAGLSVWYDEFTLRVGDSLRRSIDSGLAESRYGVVILSPSFFEKEWPQKELDGLAAREVNGVKVILPVWHELTREEVVSHSPMLADRVAANTRRGLERVVFDLLQAIRD